MISHFQSLEDKDLTYLFVQTGPGTLGGRTRFQLGSGSVLESTNYPAIEGSLEGRFARNPENEAGGGSPRNGRKGD
jgi:hypothetical protein